MYSRKTLPTLGLGLCLYLTDTYKFDKVFQRNLRTLWNGLVIAVDYKWNFNPNNADHIDELHQRVSKRILRVCQLNAGLYIKFGQQIASINHVLPPQYANTFKVLYDEAPTVPYDQVEALFEQDMGCKPHEIFASFDSEPIASASIAQVHQATLKDGTKVAVKVQKPYIATQMDWDLKTYRLVTYCFEKLFDLPIYWSVDTIERHLKTEIDFENEGKNAEKAMSFIRQVPELNRHVHVPKVFWNESSKRVLTCEWIDGIRFGDKKEMEQYGFPVKSVMSTIVKLFSDQIFRTRFVHCDPHPGNILLRHHPQRPKDYQIVLLDHGLYTTASENFRKHYALFWTSLFTMDIALMEKIAEQWGIRDIQMFASATIQRPWKPGRAVHVGKGYSMEDLFEMQTKAKDRVKHFLSDTKKVPEELVFIGRNLNLIRSNNKSLDAPVNRITIMAEIAARNADFGFRKWTFHLSLWFMTMHFYLNQWMTRIKQVLGLKGSNYEEMLDRKVENLMFEKYGIRVDMNAFSG